MGANWVMLGLGAVVGLVSVVGARDLLRSGLRQQLIAIKVRREVGSNRSPRD